ncbi:hypothetical protein Lepto782_07120 [Leptospira interrogans serovar Canicola]|uniref:Uncharacterized protein n=1 Tax=Leptospira interrogans serovar Canicola TaxID=211880 RepID=A0AAP9W9J1_LEPIR|nr:hypothetical protein Lepto782_07120 [Leptospira interrogans serovar Canicola]
MVNANLASNPRFSSPEGAPFCLNYFLGLGKYTKRIFYEKFESNVRKNLFIELKELNTII